MILRMRRWFLDRRGPQSSKIVLQTFTDFYNPGQVLVTGDARHAAWGWKNKVAPGKFSTDQPRSRVSLLKLIRLVQEHPQIQVKLGHQAR